MEKRLRFPYWRIERDLASSMVRLTRTPVPFKSTEDLIASIGEVASLIDTMGRASMALLVDLREGPMRTDPAFEQVMSEQRARVLDGISRVAVIVSTPLGVMQVSRHQRQSRNDWATFDDEAAAIAHLKARRPSSP